MTNAKRASMREGPLSALFRKTAEESAHPRKGEERGRGARTRVGGRPLIGPASVAGAADRGRWLPDAG